MNQNWRGEDVESRGRRSYSPQPESHPPHPNLGCQHEQEPDRLVWQPFIPPDEEPSGERDTREKHTARRLPGVVVLVMLITAIYVGWAFRAPISALLSAILAIGSPDSTTELRTQGLVAAGFIGVVIVAIVRILKE